MKGQLIEMICARLKTSPISAVSLLKDKFKLAGHLALYAALDRYPSQLSGGEMQRVLIFHALVGNPKLVLADEPTTALDVENKQSIMALLMNILAASGATLLVSSHDYKMIRQCCKRYLWLENGKLIETGPVAQLDNRAVDNGLTSLLQGYDQLHPGSPDNILASPE